MAFLIFTVSCEKEIINDTVINNTASNNQGDDKHAIFYSHQATSELLSPALKTAWKNNNIVSEEATDSLKSYLQAFDVNLSDRYIDHIILRNGYPFWNATKLFSVASGGQVTITPIFKENSASINAIFVHTLTDAQTAYSFVSRDELEDLRGEGIEPNFDLYDQVFKDFDQELFAIEPSDSDPTLSGSGVDEINSTDCVFEAVSIVSLGIYSDLINCSSACLTNLWELGIITEVDMPWIEGSGCYFPELVNRFLEDTKPNNENEIAAADFLIEIAKTEEITGVSQTSIFVNHFTTFFNNDIEDEYNVSALFDFLVNGGYSVMGLDTYAFLNAGPDDFGFTWGSGWTDMNMGNYFGKTDSIKAVLKNNYPADTSYIKGQWACQVLGPTHERATLNSLGLPQGNTAPDTWGFTKEPDGYVLVNIYDGLTIYEQPFFVEMKIKTTAGNYAYNGGSNTVAQFDGYRGYLKFIGNTHKPTTTIMHGLYMVLPADKVLTAGVIQKCNDDNIPLYLSGVEYHVDNTDSIRVKRGELLNIDSLDYSGHLVAFLGDTFFKWASESNLANRFDYTGVNIQPEISFTTLEMESNIPSYEECSDDDDLGG